MKTFWILFKGGKRAHDLSFTDYSQGKNIREAVARLGLTMDEVADWREVEA